MILLPDTVKRFKVIITVGVEKVAQSSPEFPTEIRSLDACKLQRMHIEGRYFYLMTKATSPRGRFTIPS